MAIKVLPSSDVPQTRSEFERRLGALMELMRSGKLQFAQGVDATAYLRIRTLPNGRVDLASVEETVRLQANMMQWFPGADD